MMRMVCYVHYYAQGCVHTPPLHDQVTSVGTHSDSDLVHQMISSVFSILIAFSQTCNYGHFRALIFVYSFTKISKKNQYTGSAARGGIAVSNQVPTGNHYRQVSLSFRSLLPSLDPLPSPPHIAGDGL